MLVFFSVCCPHLSKSAMNCMIYNDGCSVCLSLLFRQLSFKPNWIFRNKNNQDCWFLIGEHVLYIPNLTYGKHDLIHPKFDHQFVVKSTNVSSSGCGRSHSRFKENVGKFLNLSNSLSNEIVFLWSRLCCCWLLLQSLHRFLLSNQLSN